MTVSLGPALTWRGFFRELVYRAQHTLVGRTAVRQYPGHRWAPACVAQQNRASRQSKNLVPADRVDRPARMAGGDPPDGRVTRLTHSLVPWAREQRRVRRTGHVVQGHTSEARGPLWLTSTSLTRSGPCGFLASSPLDTRPSLIDPRLVEEPRVSTPQHHPSGSTPHRRFILPTTTNKREIPDILCVLIVLTDVNVPEEGVSASRGVVPHAAP